jgi:transposase InsO family protein
VVAQVARSPVIGVAVGFDPKPDFWTDGTRDFVRVLAHACKQRGAPTSIRCDNGTEFVAEPVDQWAFWNDVKLDFSRPGKPTDNAFVNRSTAESELNSSIHRTSKLQVRQGERRGFGAKSTMNFDRTQRWET